MQEAPGLDGQIALERLKSPQSAIRQEGIGVQKEKPFTSSRRSARIHLRSAAFRSGKQAKAGVGQYECLRLILASAIRDDDLIVAFLFAHATQRGRQRFFFIERGNDDGDHNFALSYVAQQRCSPRSDRAHRDR
jgi:hypothetical protein